MNTKGKKCSIKDTDEVLFGDGGSSAIIIIQQDKRVFKLFTLYDFTPELKAKDKNKQVETEIEIYKHLTENVKTNHIVKYIGASNCNNAKSLFNKCPKTYVEFMKLAEEKKTKMCEKFFKGHPQRKLNDNFKVVEIQHCDYSCADFIRDVSKLPEIDMEKYLDIFFFQIIHTILMIQKTYPYFTHNDLFMRNILGTREKDNGNFYTYTFDKKQYFVPQKKFFPKINDFGMANLNDQYKDIKLYKSEYKDIFNILFDVYNGGNLGSLSLSELCKDNPDKMKFIKLYFSNYFDVKVVDEYKLKSKNEMNWNWSNILDKDFLKSIQMKKPSDLLNGYFYNIFGKINQRLSP